MFMRAFEWIDPRMLKIFEKIADRFNWLTGKDNFVLAKIFAVINGIIFWLTLTIIISQIFSDQLIIIIISVILCIDFYFVCKRFFKLINEFEAEWLKQQEGDLRNLAFYIELKLCRLIAWCRLFYPCFVCLIVILYKLLFVLNLLAWLVWISDLAVFYLISLDKPPFAKSRALQRLKSKISEFVPEKDPLPSPAAS